MVDDNYPTISVILPFYNEENNLKRLLPSLKRMDYPKNKIEYVFVNDGSTDGSAELARKFGCRLINVNTHDIELNKGIGLHTARGDLVYWLDADMEVCSTDFFTQLTKPLVEDPTIGASFTNEFAQDAGSVKVESSLLRFISYHPLQQDPLYAFFSPDLEKQVVEKRKNYLICRFIPGKIPAVGRILYRRKELLKTAVGKSKPFIDMEAVEMYTRGGHNLYAYVPNAKIRHYHAENLRELIEKRLRNLERDYLPNYDHKYFLWLNPNDKKDIIKIIFWVIYANLFLPEFVRGIIRAVYYKDTALLWHPVVSILTTDAIVIGFLSKHKGRKIIFNLFKNLLN